MLGEFNLIERFFSRFSPRNDVVIGMGDDGAVVRVPAEQELVLVMDTLVESVHFPANTDPFSVGYKAIAVNLSDLAAMGAEPAWATLALTLPHSDESWLAEFARGLFAAASEHNLALVGGDTTRGPLTITVQLHGFVPVGSAILRSRAKIGDDIFVTGSLGDAGLALLAKLNNRRELSVEQDYLLARLNRPSARLAQALWLRHIAHAAIDISDGLLADLGHVLKASGVGARLEVDKVPLSPAFQSEKARWLKENATMAPLLAELPLNAGDDYELCFTAPPRDYYLIMEKFREFGLNVTCIGKIEPELGMRCYQENGNLWQPITEGYQHF